MTWLLQKPERTLGYSHALKWIAVLTMVIDHLGAIFFTDQDWMRLIGRLSMPIFAYLIAEGWHYTHNRNSYIKRMFIFALIAQIPFMMAFGFDSNTLNMLFTFSMSLAWLWLDDRFKSKYLSFLWPMLAFLVTMEVTFDYGFYGIALAPILYKFRSRPWLAVFLASALTVIVVWWHAAIVWWGLGPIQIFAIMGFLLVYMIPPWSMWERLKTPKMFFYWFYPAHLALFGAIAYFI